MLADDFREKPGSVATMQKGGFKEKTSDYNDNDSNNKQEDSTDDSEGSGVPSPPMGWFQKYFMLEQQLQENTKQSGGHDKDTPFMQKHRRLISFFIPFVIVQVIWWSYMLTDGDLTIFVGKTGKDDRPRWMLTLTMVFGSMVAGATSEGGAAVAFPVLTLALGVLPSIARDFSFLIQSVGMSAAAFSIMYMRVKVEWRAIVYCTIGGCAGVIYGLEKIAPQLEPAYSKMYFVVIWFAFAISLFWLNYYHDRKVFNQIPFWGEGETIRQKLVDVSIGELTSIDFVINWRALLLFAFGFLGGIFSSIAGAGLDICSFALLALFFRVSERVATPTSVILMAVNTVVAYLYVEFKLQSVDYEVYQLWLCCVPVVVVGAPLGAIMSSHFHRFVLAGLIYFLDTAQLIGALYVVRPWTTEKTDTPANLCWTSAVILVSGALFFTGIAFAGQYLIDSKDAEEDVGRKDSTEMDEELRRSIEHVSGNCNEEMEGGLKSRNYEEVDTVNCEKKDAEIELTDN